MDACGDDHVRPGSETFDGVMPGVVVSPASAVEVVAVMRAAAGARATVVVRGRGTKQSWGVPPSSADVMIDLSRLDAVVEHSAGDLVVRVQPGVTLADLAAHLAPEGQRLGIDEVVPGSTIGGVVGTGLSGPSRLSHAAVRDLILGVTIVLADGTVAHSGGKVVKNVAGYDLAKLYTGSLGTLGVVVEAIFRLHPLPEVSRWVSAYYPDETAVGAVLAALHESQVVPAAVEVDRPEPGAPIQVTVALAGIAEGMDNRVAQSRELLGDDVVVDGSAPPWWGALPGPVVVKVTSEISQVPAVLRALGAAPARPALRATAGMGIVYAGVPEITAPETVAALLETARAAAHAAGGSAILCCGPPELKAGLDVWGPVGALALMRRVKDVFDPDGRLAPGRFVGGI